MNARAEQYDTVIVGLGLTGLSCVRYFSRTGRDFAVVDSRAEPPMLDAVAREFPRVRVITGGFDEHLFRSARELIVSPGVSLHEPVIRRAIASGVRVSSDVEIFCSRVGKPVIAVTGSNGKSTVATLVGEMASAAGIPVRVAGNIGVPVLDVLDDQEAEGFVLELSSFQLETVHSLNAMAAVVLNISQDHLDRYPSFEDYAFAKQRIYQGDGVMVINRDDPVIRGMETPGRTCIYYTLGPPDNGCPGIRMEAGERYIALGEEKLLPVSALQLAGEHNVSNCLAALALGMAAGYPRQAMLTALQAFTGLPHRCQKVATINGVQWYNDSKGTNTGACCSAIAGLAGDNNIILIAGGIGKGADFSPLLQAAAGRVRTAILIGRDAGQLGAVLGEVAGICYAVDLEAAVQTAARTARPGDIVLLSPACASFDMFADYRQRGDVFIQAVRQLRENGADAGA